MNIVVLITAKNLAEAKKISKALVAKKLVACANIIKDIESFFWWEGKADSAKETLLILKTQKRCFLKIVKAVKELHSYSVPEIIALPIAYGEKKYLKWIKDSTPC